MSSEIQAYLLALGSATCFSYASLFFATLSRRLSPLWMNVFKASVAWICFAAVTLIFHMWVGVGFQVFLALFISGLVGLAIGDIFLLSAYARIGSARTIILYGFQPLFIGIAAHYVFGQEMSGLRLLAVFFFMACVFTFALEKFRRHKHWEIAGLSMALIGVLLDNTGVILSRWAFDQAPAMNAFQANLIRCTGALVFFCAFGAVKRVHLVSGWRKLQASERGLALMSSFLGTFMSLFLYLSAVKIGHLASIAALGVAAPILSSAMESLYLKKAPSKYLLIALGLFISGFVLLTMV